MVRSKKISRKQIGGKTPRTESIQKYSAKLNISARSKKRPYRFRPGTVALREIKKMQFEIYNFKEIFIIFLKKKH
jgi:histone H3